MLAGKGYSWKAAQAKLPPSRHLVHTARNPKFLLSVGLLAAVILLWRSMGSATGELQRYVIYPTVAIDCGHERHAESSISR